MGSTPANPNTIYFTRCSIGGFPGLLYAGYMQVDNSANLTIHNSAGTDITSYLPLTDDSHETQGRIGRRYCAGHGRLLGETQFLYDVPSSSSSWNTHLYKRASWSGSAWVIESLFQPDAASVSEGMLLESGPHVNEFASSASGTCFDPSTVDSVFVPIIYGGYSGGSANNVSDVRMENWQKIAGTWTQVGNTTGNTSGQNVMPRQVLGARVIRRPRYQTSSTSVAVQTRGLHTITSPAVSRSGQRRRC